VEQHGPGSGTVVLTWTFVLERVTRIELALSAWEADVLPLNYTRGAPLGACQVPSRDLAEH
jgi:hypothetical protein